MQRQPLISVMKSKCSCSRASQTDLIGLRDRMDEGEKQASTTTRLQPQLLSRLSQKRNCLATRRTAGSTPLLDSVADLLRPAQQNQFTSEQTASLHGCSTTYQHTIPLSSSTAAGRVRPSNQERRPLEETASSLFTPPFC